MPHPDSSRMPSSERRTDAAWPPDPHAPREMKMKRRRRYRRCNAEHVADARTVCDPDGNEEQERQRLDAAAPSSRPLSRPMDSEAWVAALPFSSEELEDTWPNLSGRSIFDDDR
jgi:hypothetical protein